MILGVVRLEQYRFFNVLDSVVQILGVLFYFPEQVVRTRIFRVGLQTLLDERPCPVEVAVFDQLIGRLCDSKLANESRRVAARFTLHCCGTFSANASD